MLKILWMPKWPPGVITISKQKRTGCREEVLSGIHQLHQQVYYFFHPLQRMDSKGKDKLYNIIV